MRLLLWILIGLALGPSFLGTAYPKWFGVLAQIMGASYLFNAGSELKWDNILQAKGLYFKLSLFSFLIPFVLGYFCFKDSVFIAFALSITALPVIVQVLKEKNLLYSEIGQAVLVVASVCDLLAWIGIAVILPSSDVNHWLSGHWPILFFFLGVFNSSWKKVSFPDKWCQQIFAPIFFIAMGWGIQEPLKANWQVAIPILIIGFLGKLLGGYMSAKWAGLSFIQSLRFGLIVNIRGAMEVAAAHYAYQAKLIDIQIFSSLVLLSLLSTVLAIPFLNKDSFN